jgi:hypothetical protein
MSCGKEVWSGREVWGRKDWRGSEGRDVWRNVGLEGGRWVWREVWCEKGMKGGRSGIEIRMGITREECIERKLAGVRSRGEKDWVWKEWEGRFGGRASGGRASVFSDWGRL